VKEWRRTSLLVIVPRTPRVECIFGAVERDAVEATPDPENLAVSLGVAGTRLLARVGTVVLPATATA
jgi:hypothetical protein